MGEDGDSNRGRSALVLYGSETGNAFDFAQELGHMAERLHFSTHVSCLDDVELSLLSEYSVVLIVTSTTGQGELPLNARQFWKSLLRRKLPPTYLNNVYFTTFGLGDTSYPKFNWAVRKLHKRIDQLGAHEFYPRGEADEQHEEGLDAAFVPWKIDLRRQLLETFPLSDGVQPVPEEVPIQPRWVLALKDEGPVKYKDILATSSPATQSKDILASSELANGNASLNLTAGSDRFDVMVKLNQRLTPNTHWQDVRHLVFTGPRAADYEPGDILTVFPQNSTDDVDKMLDLMDWTSVADREIDFIPNTSSHFRNRHTPPPLDIRSASSPKTLRKLLMEHLDLTAVPKRSFISSLAHFTKDQMQKERLLEFVKPEYIDELYDYTTRPRRSILEVLQEFDTVKIPWKWAAHILPELRGRQFSIASGGKWKTDSLGHSQFELLVAIVRYKTVIKRLREGVCTRYLAALPESSSLPVMLQKGSLGVTRAQASRPLVMIGPGTGIAPIRSLIWERFQWAEEIRNQAQNPSSDSLPENHYVGEMALFFGCRRMDADYFYEDEWETLRGCLPLHVYTAFSQDQKHKVYVQDLIKEQSTLIYRLLHEMEGIVYVCGSSGRMPKAVRMALTEAFTRASDMHQGDAEAYLQTMEKQGRYKQETW